MTDDQLREWASKVSSEIVKREGDLASVPAEDELRRVLVESDGHCFAHGRAVFDFENCSLGLVKVDRQSDLAQFSVGALAKRPLQQVHNVIFEPVECAHACFFFVPGRKHVEKSARHSFVVLHLVAHAAVPAGPTDLA
jgi:hypothetical protein